MNFQGTDYVVSDQVFKQFKAGYEQAQKQSGKHAEPVALLARPRPAPVADEPQERGRRQGRRRRHDQDHRRRRRQQAARRRQPGAEARRATSASRAPDRCPRSSRPSSASRSPTRSRTRRSRSTPARRTRSCAAWSSRSASSPRRTPARPGSADIKLDLSISDLNEDQEISEPSGAKPFDQLLSQLGGLGLGGLGGAGGSARRRRLLRLRLVRLEQREPREVLEVRRPTPATTSPRRASAPTLLTLGAREGRGSSASRSSPRWAW